MQFGALTLGNLCLSGSQASADQSDRKSLEVREKCPPETYNTFNLTEGLKGPCAGIEATFICPHMSQWTCWVALHEEH